MNKVTPIDAVTLLNEALQADRWTMEQLLNFRVGCNKQLAFHPTIQVSDDHRVGLLGIINGIFGINESMCGFLCAQYGQDGKLIGFGLTDPVEPDPKLQFEFVR